MSIFRFPQMTQRQVALFYWGSKLCIPSSVLDSQDDRDMNSQVEQTGKILILSMNIKKISTLPWQIKLEIINIRWGPSEIMPQNFQVHQDD